MVQMPSDWNNAYNNYTEDRQKPIPAGGYICRIMAAKWESTKNGQDMLSVAFDITEGEYAGYYKKRHEAQKANNAYAKWPGVINFFPTKKDGTTNNMFMGFVRAAEISNPGFQFVFDKPQGLTGKEIGFIFREEEFLDSSGTKRTSCKANIARSTGKIRSGDYTIPEMRKIQGEASSEPTVGFTAMEADTDDLPF